MRNFVLALCGAAFLTACGGGMTLPPKAGPEEVTLISPALGESPREGARTIGPIEITARVGTPHSELMRLLLTRGAEVGADAVIFMGTTSSLSPGQVPPPGEDEMLISRGRAIYYPAAASGS